MKCLIACQLALLMGVSCVPKPDLVRIATSPDNYRNQPPDEFRNQRLDASDNDYLLAENFANAIDTDGDTILDAPASRAITATIAAALESGRTATVVDVQ